MYNSSVFLKYQNIKKSKSLEITLSDFQEVFDTTFCFSLYEYVTSSLFNNPLYELHSEENKIYI